jgi:hypothetical protein
MTKTTKIIVIAIVLLTALGVTFNSLYQKEKKNNLATIETQRADFTKIITQRVSLINDLMNTFNQIESDIIAIKEKQNLIRITGNNELSNDRKTKLLNDIRAIQDVINNNNKKIISLTKQIKEAGGVITELQNKVNTLDSTINQNKLDIIALNSLITQKNTTIVKLDSIVKDRNLTIDEKNKVITDQINESNKAFVITGTFKNLKSKNVLTKSGGFLGVAKKKSLTLKFPDNTFKQIDISKTNIIDVNAKSAKLITQHPKDSYIFVYDNKLIKYIEITDTYQFWKFNKYAVVEIK